MSDNEKFESKPNSGAQIVKAYRYEDQNGKLIFEKLRFEPKAFSFRRKLNGKTIFNLEGVVPLPYRLPKWKNADSVIVCEGEKDADALADLGFASTSGPFGAASWPPELSPHFEGKLVFLAYDVGEEVHAENVAAAIWGTARDIRICDLPSEKFEYDISDLLDQLNERSAKIMAIKNLLRSAKSYSPPNLRVILSEIPAIIEKPESPIEIDHDFLNSWIDSLSRVTDAPKIFILFSGLGLLSGILNRHWFSYPRRVNLNLYLLLLAPSTAYRKSVCLDIVDDYAGEVDPEIILPESFTPEALLSYLKEKPSGLICWRELIQIAGFAFGSDYNRPLPSVLTDLYDSKKHFRRLTKGEPGFDIQNPSISILAAGIQSWLISMMTGRENEFFGGLWTRFLLISAPEEPDRPFRLPSRFVPVPNIISRLRTLYELEPRELMLDPILPRLKEWGEKHQRQSLKIERPEMQASFARFEVGLLKIAGILQIAAQPESTAIESKALEQSIKIIEYLKGDLPRFFAEHVHFTDFDKAKALVLRLLRKSSPIPLLKSTLLSLTHLRAKFLDDILRQLADEEIVHESSVPAGERGGRPGKAYKLIEEKRP